MGALLFLWARLRIHMRFYPVFLAFCFSKKRKYDTNYYNL